MLCSDRKGIAALKAAETLSKYGWQRRAFYLNLAACIILNAYSLMVNPMWFPIVLPTIVAWMSFYSYWTFVKRRIRLKKLRARLFGVE